MPNRSSHDRSLRMNRRQALITGAAAGFALVAPRTLRAATTPVLYAPDWRAACLPDPTKHVSIGYITQLAGLGLPGGFAADIRVAVPWSGPRPSYTAIGSAPVTASGASTVNVVGAMEKLLWNGGVLDPIAIDFYVSQANATQLKQLQQLTPTPTQVSSLGLWIANYDAAAKVYYEQFFPLSQPTVAGTLSGSTPLSVSLIGGPVATGAAVSLCKVSMTVAPANAVYQMNTAQSSTSKSAVPWGVFITPLKK